MTAIANVEETEKVLGAEMPALRHWPHTTHPS